MKRKVFSRLSAFVMALTLTASAILPVSAATNYSSANNDTNAEAVKDALANADIIDYSQKGSMTIKKYDMTAASEIDGLESIDTETTDFSSGEQNTEAEEKFKKYEIQGVKFTYSNLGKIETSSKVIDGENQKNQIKVVYEIDSELRDILGLTNTEPEDMTADNETNKCEEKNKYHYTASVLQEALKTTNEQGIVAKDKLEDYAVKHGTPMPLTDGHGLTKAENLELGLYLVVETKVPEQVTSTVDPWLISIPSTHADGGSWFYDIYAYPKNQSGNPTLEKLVRNATGKNADGAKTAQDTSYLVSEYDKNDKFITDRTEYTYDCSTTASEGDALDYILTSKLPHITSKSTYLTTYQFVDKLSKGITYDKDSIQVAIYESNPETWANDVKAHEPGSEVDNIKTYDADTNGEDAKSASINDVTNAIDVWGTSSPNRTVDIKTNDNGESEMTVKITEAGLKELNTKYSDYYIVVYYQAKLNSDETVVLGDAGNPNEVQLTWERTSTGFYDTLEDKAIVFTYGMDLTKTFSDDNGDFGQVEFTAYNDTDGYYVIAENSETVGNDKIYYLTNKTATESEATHFVPNENGKIIIRGVEGDKYILTEVKTDKKYTLLKDPIIIEIKTATQDIQSAVAGWDGMTLNDADKLNTTSGEGRPAGKIAMAEGEIESGSATVDEKSIELGKDGESANAIVGLSILNNKSWFLPQTGGWGFRLLPIFGAIIAVVGIAYLITNKRKEKQK